MANTDLPTRSFTKSLSLSDSTAIVIGSMIGSGIFIVSADMSRLLGSPGWLLIAWLLTGFMTLTAALSYGELAAMFPRAGGQYVYLREAFNPMVGFLYGWTLFLVIQTGTIAAVAVAFGKFTGVLIPWFSENNILLHIGKFKLNSSQLLAVIMVLFLTVMNSRGIRTGKAIQNVFTIAKASALISLIALGLLFFRNPEAHKLNSEIFWNVTQAGGIAELTGIALIAAFASAMVGSLFSSDAWNNITFTAGEVINPKRNIPLSLFFGTLIVTIIYILVNIVYLETIPLRGAADAASAFGRGIQFATNDRIGTAAMSIILGESAAVVMAIFIMISTFGCNNGLILAGARVYYAMAQDGLFFRSVGNLNSNNVPGKALWLQCLWASLLCLSGTYGQLLDYVVFTVLIFYILTIAGIFVLRRKMPDAERPYKAFGYPVIPLMYIVSALTISFCLLLFKPDYTWPGFIIVAIGIPVYFFWKKLER
ncbi:MAG: amino acid transporter [Ignavibacteria bacterium]|nr:amino acid transporter [Ignavibacteria bacterium]